LTFYLLAFTFIMSTLSDAKCRWCRRAGRKLFLKGAKCNSAKCVLVSRNYPPGIHGGKKQRGKASEYSLELAEKQKAKRLYGLREKQFRLMFERAGRQGDAGEHLLKMLETRLDNVIYRFGLAVSRAEARQMVGHGMFTVNGRLVNIPSYQVKAGDVVAIKKNKRQKKTFANLADKLKRVEVPGWLYFKADELEGKVLHAPSLDEVDRTINIQAIVEFYSK
jgi:small subunit ribosomal protein S4